MEPRYQTLTSAKHLSFYVAITIEKFEMHKASIRKMRLSHFCVDNQRTERGLTEERSGNRLPG